MPNHSFIFDGGYELSKMGATWFTSYAYYDLCDKTHKNWELVKTYSTRISMYRRTTHYHKYWLEQVLNMEDNRLNTNTIKLDAKKTKEMARKIIIIL